MEPTVYFQTESPDYNFGLWGRPERIAANRVVLCIITEFGLCNDMRMRAQQINALIESLQTITGSFKDDKKRIKPVETIHPATLSSYSSNILIEDTS